MCYSHFVNGVRNGATSITKWSLLNGYYKVNPIGQWEKILVTGMGFAHTFGQYWQFCPKWGRETLLRLHLARTKSKILKPIFLFQWINLISILNKRALFWQKNPTHEKGKKKCAKINGFWIGWPPPIIYDLRRVSDRIYVAFAISSGY